MPNQIYDLQDEEQLTFLYRAPKIHLEPLNINSIRTQYKQLIGVSDEVAIKMAKLTKGYSYGYQLLGYLVWNNNKKLDEETINNYDNYLADHAYDKIYSELSEKDVYYLEAICKKGYKSIQSLTNDMNVTTKEFSPYRDRLIKKGILLSPKRGEFDVALPRFKEYMNNRKMFE